MLTLSGLPLALLTIVNFADFLPSDDGVKTIDTTQSLPAARLPIQLADGTNSGFDDSIELILIGIEFGLWMDSVLGTLGIRGRRLPKLSFFGETFSCLILLDKFRATLCSSAAAKGTNAESKSNSRAQAAAIARGNDLKRVVNNQSPRRVRLTT